MAGGDLELAGKVALVTGASSGIGWQTALRLGDEGMRLCVTARRREALEQLHVALTLRGVECLVVPGDVSDPTQVQHVVRACLSRYGRLDLLVNNAGVRAYGSFETLPWAQVERIFEVNCFGYQHFARAALPHFRRQRSGHIVNVLSQLSAHGAPLLSAYAAAQHAVRAWSECLEMELAKTPVQVSSVVLPSMATTLYDHAPTTLGRAPRPLPPTFDPDLAARTIVRCALSPRPRMMPRGITLRLELWFSLLGPRLHEAALSRWGARLQTRPLFIRRPEGNLFQPVAHGVGPRGSIKPTAAWKRYSTATALLATLGGAGYLAYASAQRLKGSLAA